jgi:type II secretory pathway pseudopilin PulG
MRGRPSPPQGGFTIIHLLIVLTVLSFLAAFTIRTYFARADVTLENAAILLAKDIRAAQHRSIFLDETSVLVFLEDGEGYRVCDGQGNLAVNPVTDEPFLRRYPEDGVFHGVKVAEVQAGTDEALRIDSHGTPLSSLRVTLEYHGNHRTIVLDGSTGEISITDSSSGWKDLEALR